MPIESEEQKIWREHYEKIKTEKCYHCDKKNAGYEDTIFCQSCFNEAQKEYIESYKAIKKEERKVNKKARWQAKDNKLEYTKEYSDSNYTAQKREN